MKNIFLRSPWKIEIHTPSKRTKTIPRIPTSPTTLTSCMRYAVTIAVFSVVSKTPTHHHPTKERLPCLSLVIDKNAEQKINALVQPIFFFPSLSLSSTPHPPFFSQLKKPTTPPPPLKGTPVSGMGRDMPRRQNIFFSLETVFQEDNTLPPPPRGRREGGGILCTSRVPIFGLQSGQQEGRSHK